MIHKDPDFVGFVAAYVLLGAGSLLILVEILGFAFADKSVSLSSALIMIWFGVFSLKNLNRKYRAPSKDKERDS